MLKYLAWSMLFFITTAAHSKRFANGYTEFELPAGWQCVIEGSEWVCQSENEDRKKEAIIILAAKKRGSQDTLSEYQAYLKQPKTYQLPGSKMQRSEAKSVKIKKINGQTWVDALHLASEVPGFYTRYLATVKSDIGVAITFSVTKGLYNAYKGIFDNVIASMRIFRQTNSNLALRGKKSNAIEDFEDPVFVGQGEVVDIARAQVKKRKSEGSSNEDLLIFIVLAIVVGFVLLKLRKRK